MKAVSYEGPRKITVADRPKPKIKDQSDAILRVTTSGICGSDLHMYDGRRPSRKARDRPPSQSHRINISEAPEAYDKFDKRIDGYTKVLIKSVQAA